MTLQELAVEDRFQSLLTYMYSKFEIALQYSRDGLLSDESVEVYAQSILGLFESPVVREWWEELRRFYYSPEVHALVARKLAS
jgi:hypothetical protein